MEVGNRESEIGVRKSEIGNQTCAAPLTPQTSPLKPISNEMPIFKGVQVAAPIFILSN